MTLSEFLIKERLKLGLTQKELAEKIGLVQSTICKHESGITLPRFKDIKAYTAFFKVSADEMLSKDVY